MQNGFLRPFRSGLGRELPRIAVFAAEEFAGLGGTDDLFLGGVPFERTVYEEGDHGKVTRHGTVVRCCHRSDRGFPTLHTVDEVFEMIPTVIEFHLALSFRQTAIVWIRGIKSAAVHSDPTVLANPFGATLDIDANGMLKVSSLNSVFTNPSLGTVHSASSNLGAPTTVANGTIWLGTQSTFSGGNLTYTGTGETTDRVINLGGANNTTYRFDQSGTGLLEFTSAFTITDNRGAKTIVLQGNIAGTGEIASSIFNGDVANPNRLTKFGRGTWTLSGANFYSGITTLNAGVLSVSTISNGGLVPNGNGLRAEGALLSSTRPLPSLSNISVLTPSALVPGALTLAVRARLLPASLS